MKDDELERERAEILERSEKFARGWNLNMACHADLWRLLLHQRVEGLRMAAGIASGIEIGVGPITSRLVNLATALEHEEESDAD